MTVLYSTFVDCDLRSVSPDRNCQVPQQAKQKLSQHPHFRSRSESIEIVCRDGQLVLSGQLPTFYLKQVLQTILRDMPGVARIDNRIQVISSQGLSSTGNENRERGPL